MQSLEHWERVRELAGSLEESEETAALGLVSRLFGLQFGWRLGIGQEEAEKLFREAEAIAARTGDVRSRALLLGTYGAIRGTSDAELADSVRLSEQAIALAEESGDPALYINTALGSYSHFLTGQHERGVAILDRAIELAGGDPAVGAGVSLGCPLAFSFVFKGGFLVDLGRLNEAREWIERGMNMARGQDDIETVGWAHMWSVWLAYYTGEIDAMVGHAQQALEVAERIGDSFSRTWSWYWLGFARQQRGELTEAVEALERSRTISRERRTAREAEPFRMAILGQAYAGLGEIDRGRGLIEDAIAMAREIGYANAEVYGLVALARLLLAAVGADASDEVESALAAASERLAQIDPRADGAFIHVERAELARQLGDEDARRRALREAHGLFTEFGAETRAAALAPDLAATAG